jgi:hypothetical protein
LQKEEKMIDKNVTEANKKRDERIFKQMIDR